MFTGIIRDVGTIAEVVALEGDQRIFTIQTALPPEGYTMGASVCCSGVCLTVTAFDKGWFTVHASAETFSKTNIGTWEKGTHINLETSLRVGDELGGHLVYGHCDGQALLEEIRAEGESYRLRFSVTPGLSRYIASKGSIALDGISLTVNEVMGEKFGINIIPHTWAHTSLAQRKVGDTVNLEIDMLARYVARLLNKE